MAKTVVYHVEQNSENKKWRKMKTKQRIQSLFGVKLVLLCVIMSGCMFNLKKESGEKKLSVEESIKDSVTGVWYHRSELDSTKFDSVVIKRIKDLKYSITKTCLYEGWVVDKYNSILSGYLLSATGLYDDIYYIHKDTLVIRGSSFLRNKW